MSESLGSVEPPVLLLSTRLDSTMLHSNTIDGDVWQNQLIIANLGPHLASVVFITASQGWGKAYRNSPRMPFSIFSETYTGIDNLKPLEFNFTTIKSGSVIVKPPLVTLFLGLLNQEGWICWKGILPSRMQRIKQITMISVQFCDHITAVQIPNTLFKGQKCKYVSWHV